MVFSNRGRMKPSKSAACRRIVHETTFFSVVNPLCVLLPVLPIIIIHRLNKYKYHGNVDDCSVAPVFTGFLESMLF
jgi:hypothetical protein